MSKISYTPTFRMYDEFPELVWVSIGGESVAYFRERTCHETEIDKFFRGCDSCGWMWEVFYSFGKRERPNFCPNCGAKVVEE